MPAGAPPAAAGRLPPDLPDAPKLAANIVWFARALRRAGLENGPGQVTDAIRAVRAAGFTGRRDFYWTLHACFVRRPEERAAFAQAFRLFWRDPRYLEHMMAMLLPSIRGAREERPAGAAEKRAAEALAGDREAPVPDAAPLPERIGFEVDAAGTASGAERLRSLDFEQMSVEEMAEAKRMLAELSLPARPIPSRRTRAAAHGPLADWRAMMRDAARHGGEIRRVATRRRRERWPALVALCDISGSMSRYSRAVLRFLHAVSNRKGAGWSAVHAFTFGTRLTCVSRRLRERDVDAALAAAGAEAEDWRGGTRIGDCLRAFNRDWSRRVLGQGAVVLLISDGLDRGDPDLLEREMERLRLSSRRVIWLNPLLRWEGFAARARGMRAMLRHVDCFRSAHDIASLAALGEALSRPDDAGEKARLLAAMPAAAEPAWEAPAGLASAREIGAELARMSRPGGANPPSGAG